LPKAIQCYQSQKYPHKELLILADGEDVRDLLPPDDESIRLLHLAGAPYISEKRNFGCSEAAGDVIVHFDDDDFSAPLRVADQVSRLLASGLSVTGYCVMRFSDGTRAWRYAGTGEYALGTSLCYWKQWGLSHPFPAVQVGEDNAFVQVAYAAGQLISVDARELMWASIHPGNTSPRTLGSIFQPLAA